MKEGPEVRLAMAERRAVTAATAERYRGASKKEKGRILDEFTKLTGYERSHARLVLRGTGKKVFAGTKRYVGHQGGRPRPARSCEYDDAVIKVLKKVWKTLDYICGKRLQPVLGETAERLVRFGEIEVEQEILAKLWRISAATIDRVLAAERKKHQLKGRGQTRPGSLLKSQIPMRTFSEWNEKRPGFVEIDLVGHDGGNSSGEYLYTLNVTDVYSGWTEVAAVRNKAQVWVFEALKEIRARLPFPLLGIDSDNGSEFINTHLLRYCRDEQLTFTRSRPYRKNDNCFVEQKNYSIVRRSVGYQRLDTSDEQKVLQDLYHYVRLYVNYFQPSMRLASKERCGAKVRKKYSRAETPYRKLLGSEHLSKRQKQKLISEFNRLNPAELKRRIEALQDKLMKMATRRNEKPRRPVSPWHESNHSFFIKKHSGVDFS